MREGVILAVDGHAKGLVGPVRVPQHGSGAGVAVATLLLPGLLEPGLIDPQVPVPVVHAPQARLGPVLACILGPQPAAGRERVVGILDDSPRRLVDPELVAALHPREAHVQPHRAVLAELVELVDADVPVLAQVEPLGRVSGDAEAADEPGGKPVQGYHRLLVRGHPFDGHSAILRPPQPVLHPTTPHHAHVVDPCLLLLAGLHDRAAVLDIRDRAVPVVADVVLELGRVVVVDADAWHPYRPGGVLRHPVGGVTHRGPVAQHQVFLDVPLLDPSDGDLLRQPVLVLVGPADVELGLRLAVLAPPVGRPLGDVHLGDAEGVEGHLFQHGAQGRPHGVTEHPLVARGVGVGAP
mmetsp:Transcript_13608/g.24281  ORF Transcript_13608/g.24281 Transcript_13608/m.24281 type:complete len:352 (+) Transcript_13608:1691-2746(+)